MKKKYIHFFTVKKKWQEKILHKKTANKTRHTYFLTKKCRFFTGKKVGQIRLAWSFICQIQSIGGSTKVRVFAQLVELVQAS